MGREMQVLAYCYPAESQQHNSDVVQADSINANLARVGGVASMPLKIGLVFLSVLLWMRSKHLKRLLKHF